MQLLGSKGKILFGVVHLAPLPGSPRWRLTVDEIIEAALRDALAYQSGGAHALFIENFGDVPFTKSNVAPETVATMAAVGRAVRAAVRIPIGFNVLRNDARAGLALCSACGGSYIRVNVHTGAMLTDQGIIEGIACETLRVRRNLCPEVKIFADVHVKHAVPLGPIALEVSARDTVERGLADALIVSGQGTGLATDVRDLERVRAACPKARIFIGSGTNARNVREYAGLADGFIVGSSLKIAGNVRNAVDPKRVSALARLLKI